MEARLYAEDPARGFLPSVGRLDHFALGDEGRIESGVEEGDEVSSFYDPMIAKLVAHGADRDEAIAVLAGMLDSVEVWPVRTNAGFLFNALLHPDFAAADIDTGFIAREIDALVPDPEPDEGVWSAAAAVATAEEEGESLGTLAGFRLNAPRRTGAALGRSGSFRHVALGEDTPIPAVSGFRDEDRVVVFYEGQAYAFDRSARGSVGVAAGDGAILAPMPGKVTSVEVVAGDRVTKGQRLMTLEAMKMEHGLLAPFDGRVAILNATDGAQVPVDALLIKIEQEDEA